MRQSRPTPTPYAHPMTPRVGRVPMRPADQRLFAGAVVALVATLGAILIATTPHAQSGDPTVDVAARLWLVICTTAVLVVLASSLPRATKGILVAVIGGSALMLGVDARRRAGTQRERLRPVQRGARPEHSDGVDHEIRQQLGLGGLRLQGSARLLPPVAVLDRGPDRGAAVDRALEDAQGRPARDGVPRPGAGLAAVASRGRPHRWDRGGHRRGPALPAVVPAARLAGRGVVHPLVGLGVLGIGREPARSRAALVVAAVLGAALFCI